jgi:EmrB/QacA subfamily drug resistance transporter
MSIAEEQHRPQDPSVAAGGSAGLHEERWWTLVIVCVATFMLLLDVTIVNVALPSIQSSLHSSFSDLQWVIDAYALALATLLLTAGSVADLIGRRLVFTIGLAVFSLASLASGLSSTPLQLNLARAAQGVGGAMMFATSLALIAQAFSGRERGTAFGLWGATTGLAVAVGPLVGGALTEWAGWEWIFFINVPIGAVAIVVTQMRVSESKDPRPGGIDWIGMVTFSGSLFLLVYALIRGNADGWSSGVIVTSFVASAVLMMLFVIAEARGSDPMFDLDLFRKPAFTGASIAAFALSGSMFAMFLFLTLYLQDILGYSPLETGVRFLPISLLAFLVAPAAGKLSAHAPVRWLIGGGLLVVSLSLYLMHGLDTSSGWTALLPGFIVGGIGIGLTNAPLASTAIAVAPRERSGMASGINSTFRQVGIATGIAAYGAFFQSTVESHVRTSLTAAGLASRSQELATAISRGGAKQAIAGAPVQARAAIGHAATSSFVAGLNELFLISGTVALVGGILSAVLIRQRDLQGQHG